MAGERRHDEAVNARMDAVDAELTRLLDVTPSPEFAARVRQRVHTAPPRAWWGLVFEFAAAAAVIAVIAFAFAMRPDSPDTLAGTSDSPPVGAGLAPAPDAPAPDVGAGLAPAPDVQAPSPGLSARTQPAVIVDPAQRVALNRMIQLAQEGKLDSEMLEPPPPTGLPVEANVEVAPLTVRPLEVPAIPGARTDQK